MILKNVKREPGHFLLKRLGKKRLRPGGVDATDWLVSKIDFSRSPKILEVACNEADNIMDFAKKYKNKNVGVDLNEKAIASAKANIARKKLSQYVDVMVADATKLPFKDESFDVVINEAMLTMLSDNQKRMALKEYYRVLKKGGLLLTHDVMLEKEDAYLVKELQRVIYNPAVPHTKNDWLNFYKQTGFEKSECIFGKLTLLSRSGMIRDEGFFGMVKILTNGILDANRGQLFEMIKFFRKNKSKMNFIAIASVK